MRRVCSATAACNSKSTSIDGSRTNYAAYVTSRYDHIDCSAWVCLEPQFMGESDQGNKPRGEKCNRI